MAAHLCRYFHPARPRSRYCGAGGFGEKAVANLSAAIEAARTAPLDRLLFALGIRHLGSSTAKLLAQHYETAEAWLAAMEDFSSAEQEALQALDGIGGLWYRPWPPILLSRKTGPISMPCWPTCAPAPFGKQQVGCFRARPWFSQAP